MIVPPFVFELIREKCNAIVCPECGKHHAYDIHPIDNSELVSYSYSEDACEAFKGACHRIANTILTKFKKDPLRFESFL